MKLTRILSLILALMMVLSLGAFASGEPSAEPSAEPSGEAKSVEEAYVDYIREWLQNELLHNDQMTQEQIDNEYMPLIEAGDYTSFPVSYLYDGWLNTGTAMTFEEFAAQYQPSSGEASGEAVSVEDAYYAYLREFLEAELQVNSNMLPEQIDELIDAVKAGEIYTFPADILYNGMLETGTAMTFEEFAAQYQPAAGGDVTWADYQAWLISILPDICPDPEGVTPLIQALTGWDDIDFSNGPWEKIFSEEYFDCTTWDEFQANGGVGTFNDYEDLPA